MSNSNAQKQRSVVSSMLLSICRVEEAILEIDANQTPMERVSRDTMRFNSVGWNKHDAKFGSSLALQLRNKGDNCLSSKQLKHARHMLPKYWRQLTGIVLSWEAAKRQADVVADVAPVQPQPAVVALATCPHCQGSVEADSLFCGLCGASMKMAKVTRRSYATKLVSRYTRDRLNLLDAGQLKRLMAWETTQDCRQLRGYKRLTWTGFPKN